VVVVVPDPFREMGIGGVKELYGDPIVSLRPRSGPEVKNGRSSAKDDALERLRCGTIQKEVS